MATLNHKHFIKHDDYMTPINSWVEILQFIPKDKIIWACFYGDGESGRYWQSLGLDIIHEPIDCLKKIRGTLLLVTPHLVKKRSFYWIKKIR
jgi:hypothetical protein